MSRQQIKKQFYQQWWFWVILVVAAAICGGALSSTEPDAANPADPITVESNETNTPAVRTPHIGDPVLAGGIEVIVNSIERNYNPKYANPSDGMEYVKVNLSLKNNSDEIQSYNALHFKVEDSNGAIETYTSAAMAQADDSLKHGDLAAHGSKNGSIVFEIPISDSNLKLHIYENSFGSNILGSIELHN